MPQFVAGQEVRASELNAAVIQVAYTSSATTVVSSTTLVNATGLAIALDADSVYAWDCYLAYDAGLTADFKIAWTVPTGASGHWGAYGVATTTGGDGIGDLTAVRATGYGTGNTLSLGGNNTPSAPGPMVARPMGYVEVGSTAGNLQMMFAQNTSNGTLVRVNAGCWLRAWKLGV